MRSSLIQAATRAMGRVAPGFLRFLAHRNFINRGRWSMLSGLLEDPKCREWLASLENPTDTRHGFKIHTVAGDLTSDWIKLHGQHETGTERFILDHLKPNTTLLDIGSNIGYFSLLAAIVGKAKIVAFEPQAPIADLLIQSAALNQVRDRIRVEKVALSNTVSVMKMSSCPGNTGHAQLVSEENEAGQTYSVPVVPLDEWMIENPTGPVSVCKIDAEGVDFQVLDGMSKLIERDHPALVVEIMEENLSEFGASDSAILAFLKHHGYADISAQYTFPGDSNGYFVKRSPKD